MSDATPVVVVGAGIGGLACAHEILRLGVDRFAVRVVEAGDRPGGLIRSERVDGFLIEWAANGFLDNAPRTLELVERLGLGGELEPSSAPARRRFVYHRGRLELLPTTPGAFLASPLLSLRGRLRVALEPFARRRPDNVDETVHDFARRRIGDEAARVLVDAMVSGVFAGDTRNLSLAAAFPLLRRLEDEHGSLIRGMRARQRAARRARRHGRPVAEVGAGPAGTLTSFRDGMETLPRRLAAALGNRLELGARVRTITRGGGDGGAPGYRLHLEPADTGAYPGGRALDAAAVVIATPAWSAATIVGGLDAELAGELAAIAGAPLAVVALGYDAAAVGAPPAGFGFLVPRGEGVRILGCLWDSSIFRFRAPADRVLVRAMIGGAHDRAVKSLDDVELVRIVRDELARTMRLTAAPIRRQVIRHRHGITQYPPGHLARLARIDRRLDALGNLHLTGSSYRGIAVNRIIEDAQAVARRVVEQREGGPER